MSITAAEPTRELLRTLPGDDVRQILWRYSERFDLQMLVQSVRAVARGPVARLVAAGGRNTHDWTPEKHAILREFDACGLTSVFMDPEDGGYIEGPKNLALALAAFELAWVDGGAATCSLATGLALAPIHERGTEEQRRRYKSLCAVKQGQTEEPWRGAFALTEPIPYVGVETGLLSGKVKIAEWNEGEEPVLEVSKRGRFITNMGFANFVTAAVDTGDERIKSSCLVILEEGDSGSWDRGTPTRKLVHQLSSTNDPSFTLKVPASRIVGGYTVKDGILVPNYTHSEVIEAVFKRTRVGVGLMTAAKLLSAIEPLIRYHRDRFRGGETVTPGTPRYEYGLQQREDVLHRMLEVWATGEAAASLGFATARCFDILDPLERENGLSARDLRKLAKEAVKQVNNPDPDPKIRQVLLDAEANVLCPATKLWNTGHGANVMREAVSLMGGYGITEDCPGFLGHKWMDAQLEATYEGPEAVQRRQLSVTMTNEVFLALFRKWFAEMRHIAAERPGTGACALATAMTMWLWTMDHLQVATDADGGRLYQSARQGVTFQLADALSWILAARQFILDVIELEKNGEALGDALPGVVSFYQDLCHTQVARTAGEISRICAELNYGYRRHPAWDEQGYKGCFATSDLVGISAMVPGFDGFLPVDLSDNHPAKAGPCATHERLEGFRRLRDKLDSCLTGSQLSKDRAAKSLTAVMIPAALDYPV